ncbi:MAG: 50S ribosomal protein L11 methyltransferase [Verrucomicrobiales bacterium]
MPNKTSFIDSPSGKIKVGCRNGGPSFWPCIGDYPLYDRFLYELMSSDHIRNSFYINQLHQTSNKIVVDIGTGANAHWAIASIQSGATHVYAIEADSQACESARKLVTNLGLSNLITVIQGFSTEVTLPQKANICITEIFGEIASGEGVTSYIRDAKMRLLTADATIIPQFCLTRFAPVSIPNELFESPAFDIDALPYVESIFGFSGGPFDLRLSLENFSHNYELFSEPGIFEDIDLCSPLEDGVNRTTTVEISKTGEINGILCWLCFRDPHDQSIALDIRDGLTNWNPVFFPLWDAPLSVERNDRLALTIDRTLNCDGCHPDYHLACTVTDCLGNNRCPPASFSSPFTSKIFRKSGFYQRLFPNS